MDNDRLLSIEGSVERKNDFYCCLIPHSQSKCAAESEEVYVMTVLFRS